MPKPLPPILLVPRKEAAEKIERQIQVGRRILGPLMSTRVGLNGGRERAFEKAQADEEKWTTFTAQLLKTLFNDDSVANEFGGWWLYYSDCDDNIEKFVVSVRKKIVRLTSLLDRLPLFLLAEEIAGAVAALTPRPAKSLSRNVVIVHGHDNEAKDAVAKFLEKLGLGPIILHEQPDEGETIIEKVEHHSDVGFAVALLTPDDVGHPKDKPSEDKPRPRQNIALEFGYLIGKLGPFRVCALLKGDIELPADYAGILYKPMDDAGAWKYDLAKTIKHAGIDVDLKTALRLKKKGRLTVEG